MSTTFAALGLDKLTGEERLELAHELWDSVEAERPPSSPTDVQRQELRRRAAEADADPDGGIPWEQVKAEARARFKS